MKIEIPDLLPEGLEAEFWGGDSQGRSLPKMLLEEGFGPMVQEFIDRTLKETTNEPWIMWEGYWKLTGLTQTLLVFGVLYRRKHFHPRGILCRHVRPEQLEEAKEALFAMFSAYMDELASQLPGGNFGTGKTIGGWL